MAPVAVKGKIFVGNSGGEMGIRGWVTALDENTGKIVWRAYSVGPDKDVLIGPRFHPYYKDAQGKDLGVKTWPPGPLADRRRSGLGLDELRPQDQSDFLWHRQSRAVEFEPARRRQSLDHHDLRPRRRYRRSGVGAISSIRTISTTMTRSTRISCSICPLTARRVRCWCIPAATASCS